MAPRVAAWLSLLLFAPAACSGFDLTSPQASIVGTWELRSTNGAALPHPLYENTVERYAPIRSGRITFTADGAAVVRVVTDDAIYDYDFWYKRDGDVVTVGTLPPRARLTFTLRLERDSLLWNQLFVGADGSTQPFSAVFTRESPT